MISSRSPLPITCHPLSSDEVILINQSGRGDKDIFTIADALGDARWRAFLRDKVAAWERGGERA